VNLTQRRDIRLIVLFRTLSLVGDEIALFSLMVHFAHSNQRWMVGALAFVNAAPPVLLTPISGLILDRIPARRLLAAIGVLQAIVVGGLIVVHNPFGILALMVVLGCGVAFTQPGYGALVSHITPADEMVATQSRMQSVAAIAGMSGPALAGLIYGQFGQSVAFGIDAASFLFVGIATAFIHNDRRPERSESQEKQRGEVTAGIRWLFGDPLLRPVVIETMIFVFAINMITVSEVVLITKVMHASATTYGLVGATYGVGNLLGSLLGGKLPKGDMNIVRSLMFGTVLIGGGFGIIGWLPSVGWVFPFMIIGGIGNGIANVSAMSLFALRIPPAIQGRGFAAVGAVFTGMSLCSMAFGGVFISALPARTIFKIAGIASVGAVAVFGPAALRQAKRATQSSTQGA
jgi:MFS family permease